MARQTLEAALRRPAARVLVLLVVVSITFIILAPGFADKSTVSTTLLLAAPALLFAAGMTFVIVGGGIDLSIGSTATLASIASIGVLNAGIVPAVAAGVGVGLAIGLINGLLVVVLRINALIATLGTMVAMRGVALLVTGSEAFPTPNLAPSLWIVKPMLEVLTPMVIIAFAVVLVLHVVLARTALGRDIYAVGGNRAAARAAGIPVALRLIAAFMVCGLAAGIAGVLLGLQLGTGSPILGENAALLAVAAVVIGGGVLTGGTGGMPGTVLGVLTLTTLTTGLIAVHVSSAYQEVVTGTILVLVVVGSVAFGKIRAAIPRSLRQSFRSGRGTAPELPPA